MSAINLLFNTKLESERLHQIALGPLMTGTALLEVLGFPAPQKPEAFEWEPHGGKVDLKVPLQDGSNLWVELKVDSDLGTDQLDRQIQFVEKAGKEDKLLYILLGHSQYTVDNAWLKKKLEERLGASNTARWKIVCLKDVVDALEKPSPTRSATPGVRELSDSYLTSLQVLRKRYKRFFHHPRDEWEGGDCLGFFDWCRNMTNSAMDNCGMGYVPNRSGGFFGCWWQWIELDVSGTKAWLYPQFEFKPWEIAAVWEQRFSLQFKVGVEKNTSPDIRSEVRDTMKDRLVGRSIESLEVKRPTRMGNGRYMTVSTLNGGVPLDDLTSSRPRVLEIIQKATELAKAVAKNKK